MKKIVIITMVALGSFAVFAGINNLEGSLKSKIECCDKSKCCPTDKAQKSCCIKSCN